ncbi:MAG: NAD-dependent epimerase/dehydratase family protein [Candidatus Heimdallarchaeota archaeon]|nr:NAD-dependent epimerase/dehydratase family protein [Candidatus Heimdallarchaeota archaeon]
MLSLVTGASGFLGSHLVQELILNDYSVKALVRQSSNIRFLEKVPSLQIQYGNLGDFSSLKRATFNIEVIFHNASLVKEWGPYDIFREHNIIGTQNILEAARINDVKKIIFTGSAAIYQQKNSKLEEEADKNPLNNYQKSKLQAEQIIRDFCGKYGIAHTIIRPPGILGPRNNYIPPRMINALSKKKVQIIGSGNQKHSYVDVRDAAECLRLACEKQQAIGETFNISSYVATVESFWKIGAKILGKTALKFQRYPYWLAYGFAILSEIWGKIVQRKTVPSATRFRVSYFGKSFVLDSTKAKDILDFQPKFDLETSMKDMFDWWFTR